MESANRELIKCYNSKDRDIVLGRRLIESMESYGIHLTSGQKNILLNAVTEIYSDGAGYGQKRIAGVIKKIAEKHNEVLPPATLQYIDQFEVGYFEDSEAFNRNKARISKDAYYLGIAEAVLARSTCIRRRYGAVIVKDDEFVASGYNGSPRGETNCIDRGYCDRELQNIPKGERYEMCMAVHAEQNAIISAYRREMIGATMYIVGREVKTWEYADPQPCMICRRLIKNAGITRVVGLYKGEIIECNI